jgi:hypothetical protein
MGVSSDAEETDDGNEQQPENGANNPMQRSSSPHPKATRRESESGDEFGATEKLLFEAAQHARQVQADELMREKEEVRVFKRVNLSGRVCLRCDLYRVECDELEPCSNCRKQARTLRLVCK